MLPNSTCTTVIGGQCFVVSLIVNGERLSAAAAVDLWQRGLNPALASYPLEVKLRQHGARHLRLV